MAPDFIARAGAFYPSVPDDPPEGPAVSPFIPAGQTTRVMAVGDSLTLGQGSSATGGYRLPLWNHLKGRLASDALFLPAGPNTTPPYSDNGDPYYGSRWAGFGGWKINDLICSNCGGSNNTGQAMTEWVANNNPHVLLLMIGTNDLAETANQVTLRARFNALLDLIYDLRPTIPIVHGRIPQYQTTVWPAVTTYNDMCVEELGNRVLVNPDRLVVSANMESIRGENKYSDYVHLNQLGYTEMASLWSQALIGEPL